MSPALMIPAGLALLLSLNGCALMPPDEEPPPALGPDEFAERIDRLEDDLGARCSREDREWEDKVQRDRQLGVEIREVGSLLRSLRSDMSRVDFSTVEPVVVQPDCRVEDTALSGKVQLGRSEWIGLPDVGTYLRARIDSGANTSSLSAVEITDFERDGEDWIRFKLGVGEDAPVVEDVRDEWIEAPVERRVRIVQASGEESRPVISLLMTLGPINEPVEFTLSDRSHLDYPVLLGRRFLMDIAVIDVADSYRHARPEYPGGRPAEEAERDEVNDDGDEDADEE
jgi:hypothetical protein